MSGWESAFVATWVALGGSLEDAERAMGESAFTRAATVVRGLRAPHRGSRASALAVALAPAVQELVDMELR